MADKELEQLEKVNNDNKMEIVKLEERIANQKKERDEEVKTITEMGIAIDEAEVVLENSEEEYSKLLADGKKKLGIK